MHTLSVTDGSPSLIRTEIIQKLFQICQLITVQSLNNFQSINLSIYY